MEECSSGTSEEPAAEAPSPRETLTPQHRAKIGGAEDEAEARTGRSASHAETSIRDSEADLSMLAHAAQQLTARARPRLEGAAVTSRSCDHADAEAGAAGLRWACQRSVVLPGSEARWPVQPDLSNRACLDLSRLPWSAGRVTVFAHLDGVRRRAEAQIRRPPERVCSRAVPALRPSVRRRPDHETAVASEAGTNRPTESALGPGRTDGVGGRTM